MTGPANSKPARSRAAPDDGAMLLTDEQAARLVFNVSERTFAELVATASWLPRPIVLGPRLRRWHRGELDAALKDAPRQDMKGGEPAQLRRGKIERMKAREVAQ